MQFCNQMVNYDIPWNPDKLEQRMGRIHRIGQKNEVFVFNLVAGNTREVDVMRTLLKKIEQMRKDLGKDLVYDFIGDILDDNDLSLAELMAGERVKPAKPGPDYRGNRPRPIQGTPASAAGGS